MEDKKILKAIYYFLSIVCYLVAILFVTKSDSNGMGIFWLLLGSFNLCFGSAFSKKSRNKD